MLSKWLPWDFVRNHGSLLEKGKFGLYCFSCYDSFLERMFLGKIPADFYSPDKLTTVVGSDVTQDWIDSNLMTMDLFGTNDSYLVLNGDAVPSDVKKQMIEGQLDYGQRYVILTFSGASKFFDQLSKNDTITCLKVEPARFWEGGKLLGFLCDELKIRLPHDVENYILESIPNNVADFINALKLIALNFPDRNRINLPAVKDLISPVKLDQFKLASWYSSKKKDRFFSHLIKLGPDFDTYRNLFSFMQGHLLKLADTSYIEKKARPSKYDKEILGHSKLWNVPELRKELRLMGELEIAAKKRSPSLDNKIKEAYLATFN